MVLATLPGSLVVHKALEVSRVRRHESVGWSGTARSPRGMGRTSLTGVFISTPLITTPLLVKRLYCHLSTECVSRGLWHLYVGIRLFNQVGRAAVGVREKAKRLLVDEKRGAIFLGRRCAMRRNAAQFSRHETADPDRTNQIARVQESENTANTSTCWLCLGRLMTGFGG